MSFTMVISMCRPSLLALYKDLCDPLHEWQVHELQPAKAIKHVAQVLHGEVLKRRLSRIAESQQSAAAPVS
eukprot:3131989-Amphidinium_carterae.1